MEKKKRMVMMCVLKKHIANRVDRNLLLQVLSCHGVGGRS